MQEKEKTYESSAELLSSLKFCVIDLETTGGNPDTEKIIEIGMVKIENRKITEERSFLVNPQKDIPDFVQKLTGIRKADVEHSPKIEEVIDAPAYYNLKRLAQIIYYHIRFEERDLFRHVEQAAHEQLTGPGFHLIDETKPAAQWTDEFWIKKPKAKLFETSLS